MGNGVESFLAAAARETHEIAQRAISDGELEQVLTAAVALYARRSEATGTFPPPLARSAITATEVLTTVSEMIRIVDINIFDLSMWYRRPK